MLASVCVEDKWKHFVGKKTRSPYVSKEGREAYNRVMEFTNVNHKNIAVPDDIRKLNSKIEDLREQIIQKDKRLKSLEKFEKDVLQKMEEYAKKVESLNKLLELIPEDDKVDFLNVLTIELRRIRDHKVHEELARAKTLDLPPQNNKKFMFFVFFCKNGFKLIFFIFHF